MGDTAGETGAEYQVTPLPPKRPPPLRDSPKRETRTARPECGKPVRLPFCSSVKKQKRGLSIIYHSSFPVLLIYAFRPWPQQCSWVQKRQSRFSRVGRHERTAARASPSSNRTGGFTASGSRWLFTGLLHERCHMVWSGNLIRP